MKSYERVMRDPKTGKIVRATMRLTGDGVINVSSKDILSSSEGKRQIKVVKQIFSCA